mgnify:CR=1 FL=1
MRKWFIMKLKKIFIACSLLVGTVSSWAVNDNNLPIGESNAAVPTYVVINPNALAQNIKVMRQTIGSGVKICLVLKADAYGNGIANLINEAIKQNVEYIAAVDNSEFAIIAPAIKKSGKNIHMLRIAPVTKAELIEEITNGWNIEEVAGSVEEARMISTVAQEMSKKLHKKITIGVHLNIETGMGRMAVRDVSDMKQIIALPNLKLVGVMTHFARDYEDSPVDYEYTSMQLNMFESAIAQLNLESDVIKHVANSAAALKFPWTRLDMVRVGAIMYGADFDGMGDESGLSRKYTPVMQSFKTTVGIIESNVPPHSPINYDGEEFTRDDRASTTATLRVGYNYGFPRYAYKEKVYVLIEGQKFPVIGKSSMNMVVVDITDQDPKHLVKNGDEVVIVGKQGNQEITWSEFAKKNNMDPSSNQIIIGNQNIRRVIKSND